MNIIELSQQNLILDIEKWIFLCALMHAHLHILKRILPEKISFMVKKFKNGENWPHFEKISHNFAILFNWH